MSLASAHGLSRRERQIMDALFRLGRAPAATIQQQIPSAPSYSTVRALLTVLERKGHVRHVVDGPRYIYEPVAARAVQRRSALRHLVRTFFDGSPAEAMLALLDAARREGR
jgi:predicted transcriptional regulator